MYYRKIEGNRDLPADDRAKPTVTAVRFYFHKKTFSPVMGSPYIFSKFFRFGGSIPPVRLARFSNSSLANISILYTFLFQPPYFFLGAGFLVV